MRLPAKFFAVVLAIGFSVAACGQASPTDVATEWASAVTKHDIERLCEMSSNRFRDIASRTGTCREGMRYAVLGDAFDEIKSPRVTKARTAGDTAALRLVDSDEDEFALCLVREDKQWRIDNGAPLSASRSEPNAGSPC